MTNAAVQFFLIFQAFVNINTISLIHLENLRTLYGVSTRKLQLLII